MLILASYDFLRSPYRRTEMYIGSVACCTLVSHGEYSDGTDRRTDGRTPDGYNTLSARRGQQRNNNLTDAVTLHERSLRQRRCFIDRFLQDHVICCSGR